MFTFWFEDDEITREKYDAWAKTKSPAPGTPCRVTMTGKDEYTGVASIMHRGSWKKWIDDAFRAGYKDCVLVETKRGGRAVAAISLRRSEKVPVGIIELKMRAGETWSGIWAVWWKPKENKFVTNCNEEIFFDEK